MAHHGVVFTVSQHALGLRAGTKGRGSSAGAHSNYSLHTNIQTYAFAYIQTNSTSTSAYG